MVVRLTNNNFDDSFTAISGKYGIWSNRDNTLDNDLELYLFNGRNIVQLTRNNLDSDSFVNASNTYVVWNASITPFGVQDLFLYNGTRIIQLTNNNRLNAFSSARLGALSDRYAVWEFSETVNNNFDSDLGFYNGRTITRLTNNAESGDGVVNASNRYIVYTTFDGNDTELFLYDGLTNTRRRLTFNTDNESGSLGELNDRYAVWTSFDGNDNELFLYNGRNIVRLTNNASNDFISSDTVSKKFVTWSSSPDGNDDELFLYNGTRRIQLTNNTVSDFFEGLSDNYVTWQDGNTRELYLHDGVKRIALTGERTSSEDIQGVTNRYAVWNSFDGNDFEFFVYNGARRIQITNNGINESFVDVSNRYVVWSEFNDVSNSNEFYLYNGVRNVQLTNARTTNETIFDIGDRYLVWSAIDGNDTELYVYNGNRIVQLTNNNSDSDILNKVSGNYIVWTSSDNNDNELFVYNGFRTIQVTRNSTEDFNPEIADNNLFWTNRDPEGDNELYAENLSRFAPNIVINNTTVVEGFKGAAVFTVSLLNAGAFPVTLRYSTANGTALAGRDYVARTGSLTFTPGQTTKTIAIRLLNNNLNESNEAFSLRLSNARDGVISDRLGIATISDTLVRRTSTTLPSRVENLTLTGIGNINGLGNALNNQIIGNNASNRLNGLAGRDVLVGRAGNDRLTGGLGIDTLIGGQGADIFAYNSRNERRDIITDFTPVSDTILVSAKGFGGGLIANATLPLVQFRLGARALDASDRFIYNRNTGALLFDVDGTGAIAPVALATLDPRLALTRTDIFVTA